MSITLSHRRLGLFALAMSLGLGGGRSSAAIWVVDSAGSGDFTSISSAISSAMVVDGDSVQVKPGLSGHYGESILLDKAVHLFTLDSVSLGPGPMPGTVVSVTSGAVGGFIPTVEGFTISGGSSSTMLTAGGVHISPGAEASLLGNKIMSNTGGDGAGVSVIDGRAHLRGNTISGNFNSAAFGGSAAGLLLHATSPGLAWASVEANTFTGNYSTFGSSAISVHTGAEAIITGNVIAGNGGGPSLTTKGFATLLFYGEGKILNNQFTGNIAGDTIFFGPSAGISETTPEEVLPGRYFAGVDFINNTVTGNVGVVGGVAFEGDDDKQPKVFIANSIIAGNVKDTLAAAPPGIAKDLYFLEMPSGHPDSVIIINSLIGLANGHAGAASWTADQIAGKFSPSDDPTNVVEFAPTFAAGFAGFSSATFGFAPGPFPPGTKYFATSLGDFHPVDPLLMDPMAPAHAWKGGSFDAAFMAGILSDLEGVHLRYPSATDIGAFQSSIPEPGSLMGGLILAAGLGLRTRRARVGDSKHAS